MSTLVEVFEKLSAPWPDKELNYRVGNTWPKDYGNQEGSRAGQPLAYIKAEHVMDRLDQVVGPAGWADIYSVQANGSVVCELTVLGVTKAGIGEAGEQEREATKSAESDALKRAAVKFGIGRYLRRRKLKPTDLVQRGKYWFLPGDYKPEWLGENEQSFNPGPQPRPAQSSSPTEATGTPAPVTTGGDHILSFGKRWKGKPVSEIETGYLEWMLRDSPNQASEADMAAAKAEFGRRQAAPQASPGISQMPPQPQIHGNGSSERTGDEIKVLLEIGKAQNPPIVFAGIRQKAQELFGAADLKKLTIGEYTVLEIVLATGLDADTIKSFAQEVSTSNIKSYDAADAEMLRALVEENTGMKVGN